MLTCVPVCLAVVFCTLAERAVLSGLTRRSGPRAAGFLQPVWDGLKLALRERVVVGAAAAPWWVAAVAVWGASGSVAGWAGLTGVDAELGVLALLAISSLAAAHLLATVHAAPSAYGLIAGPRVVALLTTYELTLGSALLAGALGSASDEGARSFNLGALGHGVYALPLALLWAMGALGETKRIPLDAPEAESELVAGYAVEYASAGFAQMLIAEYGGMLLAGGVWCALWRGGCVGAGGLAGVHVGGAPPADGASRVQS